MNQLTSVLVTALTMVASVANAADTDRYSCSMWATVVSRSLFNNSGTFATKGSALIAIPECVDTETGFYGNLFLSAPLREFDTGKEIDVRLGKRFKVGEFDIDASVADYYFGIGATVGKNTYNTVNGRVRVSHRFDLGSDVDISPYLIGDYQRSLDLHAGATGVALGATAHAKLSSLPGQPVLAGEVSTWYYPKTFTTGKGPISDADVSLGYQVSKNVVAGPRARWTWGDVAVPSDRRSKHMYGVFMAIKF